MAAGMEKRLAATGMGAITPESGLQSLEYLMRHTSSSSQAGAQIAVLPINWAKLSEQLAGKKTPLLANLVNALHSRSDDSAKVSTSAIDKLQQFKSAQVNERPAVSLTYVQGQVAQVMGIPSSKPVDPYQTLSSLGLDSLMAMELKNRVEADLKVTVPVTALLEGPTIIQFAEIVLNKLNETNIFGESSSVQADAVELTGGNPASALENLDQLSDADVDAMLNQLLLEKEDVND